MVADVGEQAFYERTGGGYAERRRPDPRIEAVLHAALGDARSVVNIGAGTGSYEPRDRRVIAVEPARVMLAQRTSAAPRVQAVAEALPLRDHAFDVALAILTLHHWSDWQRGVAELRRVARRAVIVTFDPAADPSFWLFDYFPQILARDRLRMPPLAALCGQLGAQATPLLVPYDCTDGFLGAYWREPTQYLDAGARSAMSGFGLLAPAELAAGLQRLAADLASGAWHARHGYLLHRETLDIGYRVVAGAFR
jgi:SAM-dependent methyltransferase